MGGSSSRRPELYWMDRRCRRPGNWSRCMFCRLRPDRRQAPWAARTVPWLILAICVGSPTAGAQAAELLEPFQAAYTWIWHGAPVAVSTLKLEQRQPGTWSYASSSEPRGLGFLYPMRPQLESLMRIG